MHWGGGRGGDMIWEFLEISIIDWSVPCAVQVLPVPSPFRVTHTPMRWWHCGTDRQTSFWDPPSTPPPLTCGQYLPCFLSLLGEMLARMDCHYINSSEYLLAPHELFIQLMALLSIEKKKRDHDYCYIESKSVHSTLVVVLCRICFYLNCAWYKDDVHHNLMFTSIGYLLLRRDVKAPAESLEVYLCGNSWLADTAGCVLRCGTGLVFVLQGCGVHLHGDDLRSSHVPWHEGCLWPAGQDLQGITLFPSLCLLPVSLKPVK